MATEFGYLLNAMERAACESNPAKHNYHDKRIAVLGHVSAIEAERDRLRAELAECRAILEKIADPVHAMQRELPEGARLNGAMAVALSNDPNYLKGLAKAGLFDAAHKGEGEKE